MAQLRVEPSSGTGLLVINTLIAAAFLIDPWVGVIVGDPARSARMRGGLDGWAVVAGMWLAEVLLAAAVLWLLTGIEHAGIRFFARRRGWRLTPEAAWQVCCHASVGWVLVGVLPLLVLGGLQAVLRVFHAAPSNWGRVPVLGGITWSNIWYGGSLLLAMGAGLLVFEWLVHVGVRKCRYAATAPPNITPSSLTASMR